MYSAFDKHNVEHESVPVLTGKITALHQAVGELQGVLCDSVTVSSTLITALAFVQDKSSSLGRSEINTGLCMSFCDSSLKTEKQKKCL